MNWLPPVFVELTLLSLLEELPIAWELPGCSWQVCLLELMLPWAGARMMYKPQGLVTLTSRISFSGLHTIHHRRGRGQLS